MGRRITPLTPAQRGELIAGLQTMANRLVKIRVLIGNAHPFAHPIQRKAEKAMTSVRALQYAIPEPERS